MAIDIFKHSLAALALFSTASAALAVQDNSRATMPRVKATGADPIARAINGMVIQVEDDLSGGGDTMLRTVRTRKCMTTLTLAGKKKRPIRIDWRTAEVRFVENFIYIKDAGMQFALVALAETEADTERLSNLNSAVFEQHSSCAEIEEMHSH